MPNPFISDCPTEKLHAVAYLCGIKASIRWLGDNGNQVPSSIIADYCDLERHVLRMGTRDEVDHG
mgnify:CR=1 FL=1